MLMRKNKNKLLNDYPCSDYLHNALCFLREGNVDAAYDEICWAITKSGGELTEEEKEFREHPIIRGNGSKSVLCIFDEEDKVYLTVCPNCKGGPINFSSDECEFCGQKLDWPMAFPKGE